MHCYCVTNIEDVCLIVLIMIFQYKFSEANSPQGMVN